MRTAHDKTTLEDFALKSMGHAKMTGVCLGAHAIADSFLLMHTGVGCKYKTASQAAQHDWGEHPNVREAWTQVSEAHLVAGCATRIGPFARAWWERRNSAVMVVVSAYFIELTGDDVAAECERVEATMPDCPFLYIPTVAPNQGFFDGYTAVMLEVVKRCDFSKPPTQPKGAAIVGHFFHRYEPDQRADVGQLKALVKAGGLELGALLFSGQTFAETKQITDAKHVLMLPYARPHEKQLRRRIKGREIHTLDLPIGISGTARFVRTLTQVSGGDARKTEAWIQSSSDAVRKEVDRMGERLRTLSFAVFAETPLAAGLVTLLRELGVRVPIVGLRDTDGCLGGKEAFYQTLERNGLHDHGDMEVLQEPSLRRILERVRDTIDGGTSLGIIGSSHEVDLFLHGRPGEWLPSQMRLIETGFPQDTHHAVYLQSTYGFAGVVGWAQRILDTVYAPRIEFKVE